MKPKLIITIALLLFVAVSVAALVLKNSSSPGARTDNAAVESIAGKLVVYYFHRTQRCPTCLKIEELAAAVVKQRFADQLKDGKLVWRVVNIETPGNEHFETDYNLITQSLIVTDYRNSAQTHWKNLDKIWELVWTEPEFNEYVASEISNFAGEF